MAAPTWAGDAKPFYEDPQVRLVAEPSSCPTLTEGCQYDFATPAG
ncbi:MAG: hypothetical protein R2749_10170 [Acidimicrobiales bacterium]